MELLPVYWATFNLSYHAWDAPIERAIAAAAKNGVTLYAPKPGEVVRPAALPQQQRWRKKGAR